MSYFISNVVVSYYLLPMKVILCEPLLFLSELGNNIMLRCDERQDRTRSGLTNLGQLSGLGICECC